MSIEAVTITIVSDLHLATGADAGTGNVDPMERFFHDAAFAHFIDCLRDRAITGGGSQRLLILGDLFDFPRVSLPHLPAHPSLDAQDAAAIAKLDQIAEGHDAVFSAAGRWLAAGLPIDIVPGNHDAELVSTPVQRHLRRLLARAGGIPEEDVNLTVYPWIYHLPGLLYAEHGHQYHDINSVPALVRDSTAPPDGSAPSLGADIDQLVMRVTNEFGAEIDDSDSLAGLMRNVIRSGPRGMVRATPHLARFLAAASRHVAGLGSPRRTRRRAAYRAVIIPGQAIVTALPEDVLVAIDRLAEASARRLPLRIAGMAIHQMRRPRPRRGPGQASETEPRRRPSYLYRAAADIHAILTAAGLAVPFYVFGHSHVAEHLHPSEHAGESIYLNSGSWSGHRHISDVWLTFVNVERDLDTGEASASVMRWNDARGRIEPVTEPTKTGAMPVPVDIR